jgi:hypothetical protein
VKGDEDNVRAHVVVASVQTLSRPRRLERFVAAMDAEASWLVGAAEPLGLVVVDEAHHATADSYARILDALHAGARCGCPDDHDHVEMRDGAGAIVADYCTTCGPGCVPAPLLLGVTATPDRGDGKGLIDRFDEIVWSYDMLWGIRAGYLSDVRGKRVRLERLDLSKIKVSKGDYEAGAAGRAMEDADAPTLIVRAWLEHARDRRTLVFTPTVALAHAVAAEYAVEGIAVGVVSGETPIDDRRRILRDYSDGRIQVIANCAVLTEGYDEPRTDCVVVARPTKSRAFYTQMVGRGTRKHPEKSDLLVIDVVGASDNLSLMTIPSLFGVEGRWIERMESDGAVAAIDERDQEEVRAGRLRAEDVDLFHRVRTAGRLAWVPLHTPESVLKRYVLGLGRGPDGRARSLHLATGSDGETWRCTLHVDGGTNATIAEDVPLDAAQTAGEDYARASGSIALTDPAAPWRSRRPSDKARAAAAKWKLPGWADYRTAGELADALNAHIERARMRRGRK